MIYTSCYSNIRKLIYEHGFKYPDFIGISIYKPVLGYQIQFEKKLAPKKENLWLFKNGYISWKEYANKYFNQLYNLEKKYLDNFINRYDGKVFLCYEKSDEYCHRKLLRKFMDWYFGFKIGMEEFKVSETIDLSLFDDK